MLPLPYAYSFFFSPLTFDRTSNPNGAHERDRTADLVLTKDVLYQLSNMGSDSIHHPKTKTTKSKPSVLANPVEEQKETPSVTL
jgi:hypothetical protein